MALPAIFLNPRQVGAQYNAEDMSLYVLTYTQVSYNISMPLKCNTESAPSSKVWWSERPLHKLRLPSKSTEGISWNIVIYDPVILRSKHNLFHSVVMLILNGFCPVCSIAGLLMIDLIRKKSSFNQLSAVTKLTGHQSTTLYCTLDN